MGEPDEPADDLGGAGDGRAAATAGAAPLAASAETVASAVAAMTPFRTPFLMAVTFPVCSFQKVIMR
jgi:hypothetical protein